MSPASDVAAATPAFPSPAALEKLARLRARLAELESVLVAFSGGVDSTFLLRVAHDVLGDRAVALTAVSPTLARREAEEATRLAALIGARHERVVSCELARPEFVANGPERCYHCKRELCERCREVADRLSLRHILVGSNLDDLGDHRPGMRAAAELGAGQPLLEVGLTKAEVRELSASLGLPTWDKPQLACLASRIAYGLPVTRETLERVDHFEEELRSLGFAQLRVRVHQGLARIEVAEDELGRALDPAVRGRLLALGRQLGFTYLTLDLAGFRSGSGNEVLKGNDAAAP